MPPVSDTWLSMGYRQIRTLLSWPRWSVSIGKLSHRYNCFRHVSSAGVSTCRWMDTIIIPLSAELENSRCLSASSTFSEHLFNTHSRKHSRWIPPPITEPVISILKSLAVTAFTALPVLMKSVLLWIHPAYNVCSWTRNVYHENDSRPWFGLPRTLIPMLSQKYEGVSLICVPWWSRTYTVARL